MNTFYNQDQLYSQLPPLQYIRILAAVFNWLLLKYNAVQCSWFCYHITLPDLQLPRKVLAYFNAAKFPKVKDEGGTKCLSQNLWICRSPYLLKRTESPASVTV